MKTSDKYFDKRTEKERERVQITHIRLTRLLVLTISFLHRIRIPTNGQIIRCSFCIPCASAVVAADVLHNSLHFAILSTDCRCLCARLSHCKFNGFQRAIFEWSKNRVSCICTLAVSCRPNDDELHHNKDQ